MGYARRNFLVPVPSYPSFDALNAHLEERCLERLGRRLRGHDETIGQRMERDRDALLPLPATHYDASDRHVSRVSSLSLVRYRTNDYSVPVAYGHREVLVRGYVDRVVISCGSEVIARHIRSYERDDFVFDPIHYLPLLERKVGALDQAAPFAGWELPDGKAAVLLEHHLRELKLPTFLREYGKVAGVCAAEGVDHPGYLLRLAELELIDRHHRIVDRRIKAARFPRGQEPRHIRLPCHAVCEQAPCHAAGTKRVHRPARPMSRSAWDWPPARGGCRSASPPRPPWYTN